jgi:hypothetical protein
MTEKPSPPAPFLRACRMFHVNIAHFCPTIERMAAFATQNIEGADRDTLAEYLDQLLSEDYTDDELKELWNSSGADVFVPDVKNLVALFTEMKRQLRAASE